MLTRRATRQNRAIGGFNGDRFDRHLLFLLQITSHPRNRPPGTDPSHEDIDFPFGIVKDFRPGRLEVDGGIRRILELLRHIPAILTRKLFRFRNRPLHPIGPWRQNQLGTEAAEHHPPLNRHRFRHGECQRVSASGTDERECNPGVATRRLNDLHPRPQLARSFCIPDHGGTDPTFHAVCGVSAFNFRINRGMQPLCQSIDFDQWRATDRFRIVLENRHLRFPFCRESNANMERVQIRWTVWFLYKPLFRPLLWSQNSSLGLKRNRFLTATDCQEKRFFEQPRFIRWGERERQLMQGFEFI